MPPGPATSRTTPPFAHGLLRSWQPRAPNLHSRTDYRGFRHNACATGFRQHSNPCATRSHVRKPKMRARTRPVTAANPCATRSHVREQNTGTRTSAAPAANPCARRSQAHRPRRRPHSGLRTAHQTSPMPPGPATSRTTPPFAHGLLRSWQPRAPNLHSRTDYRGFRHNACATGFRQHSNPCATRSHVRKPKMRARTKPVTAASTCATRSHVRKRKTGTRTSAAPAARARRPPPTHASTAPAAHRVVSSRPAPAAPGARAPPHAA